MSLQISAATPQRPKAKCFAVSSSLLFDRRLNPDLRLDVAYADVLRVLENGSDAAPEQVADLVGGAGKARKLVAALKECETHEDALDVIRKTFKLHERHSAKLLSLVVDIYIVEKNQKRIEELQEQIKEFKHLKQGDK